MQDLRPRPVVIAEHMLWGLRHPLRAFLWTLLALFAIRPALDGTPYLYVVDGLFVMLIVAALRALVESRALFVAALAVVALTVASRIAGDVKALHGIASASAGLSALLVGLLLGFLFWHVIRAPRVTYDVILSAITVYVLIGVFWGFVYLLLHDASPGAFALDPSQGSAEVQLRYFSLMTLTTVGYGDIVPKSGEARALATIESLLGQIYLTAIVARLVGISIAIPMPGGEARGPLNRPVDAPDADADGR
jgi:hypothetical protein